MNASYLPPHIAKAAEVYALPAAFQLVQKADLPALSVTLQFPDLFDEVAILQRLEYKNNNQHRASKHHQAVCQVLRVLRHFQQLQLPALLQSLHTAAQRTALPEAPADLANSSKRARRQQQPRAAPAAAVQRQALHLPTFQAGCLVLRCLLSGTQLLLHLHGTILTAAQHLSGQLSRGYFMPYCLVAAAAVSRIRVLATAALLQLLQAYSTLIQLLPLLPAAATATVSDDDSTALSASSAGLPQMLQLAWNGPLPALRSIPFEPEGPQSLQGLAAELRQAYCISSCGPEQRDGGGAVRGAEQGARPAAAGLVPRSGAEASEAGVAISREAFAQQQQQGAPAISFFEDKQPQRAADVGDAGVAVSREAFTQQLEQLQGGMQRPQQQAKQRPTQQTTQLTQQQQQQRRQQQQGGSVVAVSFFEDKQPQRNPTAAGLAQGPTPAQQPPLYTTVPGLGFSLGGQHNPGPDVSNLLGVGAAAATGGLAGAQTAAGAAAAGAPPAVVAEPMDIDGSAAEDQEEFYLLYGKRPTPAKAQPQSTQQGQQGLLQQAGPPQPHQPHQQQQQPAQGVIVHPVGQLGSSVGQVPGPKAGARKGLQAAAACLAMQGANSSDDGDDDMPGPPAAAVAAVAVPGLATAATMQSTGASGDVHSTQQPGAAGMQLQQMQQPLPASAPMQAPVGLLPHPPAAVQPAALASQGASAALPAAAAGTAGGQALGAASADGEGGGVPPLLQAALKKSKQKRKGKQQKPAADAQQGAEGGAARDSILDMLLHGL